MTPTTQTSAGFEWYRHHVVARRIALGLAMMLRVLVGALLGVFLCNGMAGAGDTPVYKAAAASVPATMPGFFYAGVSFGERWSDTVWTTTAIGASLSPPQVALANPKNFDRGTARIGGYAGYVWRITPTWVTGLEADIDWGNSDKTISGIPGTCSPKVCGSGPLSDSSSVKEGWDGSIRARLGFLVTPSWLVYGTGGLAWQNLEISANCRGTASSCETVHSEAASATKAGWTMGAGVDVMLRDSWLARIEYRFADYGHLDHTFFARAAADQVMMNESLRTRIALIGFHYKFAAPSAAIAKN